MLQLYDKQTDQEHGGESKSVPVYIKMIGDTAADMEFPSKWDYGSVDHHKRNKKTTRNPVVIKFKGFQERLELFKEKTDLTDKKIVVTVNMPKTTTLGLSPTMNKEVARIRKIWTEKGDLLTTTTTCNERRDIEPRNRSRKARILVEDETRVDDKTRLRNEKIQLRKDQYVFFTIFLAVALRVCVLVYNTISLYWRYSSGTTFYFDFYFYLYILAFILLTLK